MTQSDKSCSCVPSADCPLHGGTPAPSERFRQIQTTHDLADCRLCGSHAELWQRWRRDDVWDSFGCCSNLKDVDGEACLFHLPGDPAFYRERKKDAVLHWNLIMGPRPAPNDREALDLETR